MRLFFARALIRTDMHTRSNKLPSHNSRNREIFITLSSSAVSIFRRNGRTHVHLEISYKMFHVRYLTNITFANFLCNLESRKIIRDKNYEKCSVFIDRSRKIKKFFPRNVLWSICKSNLSYLNIAQNAVLLSQVCNTSVIANV